MELEVELNRWNVEKIKWLPRRTPGRFPEFKLSTLEAPEYAWRHECAPRSHGNTAGN
jgi:hypothetical protein